MFESLVSRLKSPGVTRKSPGSREVHSDPEDVEPIAPPKRGRAAKLLLEKKRRARRSCVDLTEVGVQNDFSRGMGALKALLPLRQSKSLGRLDGLKEIERLAAYERLIGNGTCGRKQATRLSDLERVQDLFLHDNLGLHENNHPSQKWSSSPEKIGSPSRTFLMEAPVQFFSLNGGATLDRHLFLFSDLLIVGKARGGGRFKLKERVKLGEVWTATTQHDTGFLLGWATPTGPVTHLAVYSTQAARDTWHRKITSALSTQLELEPKSTNIQVVYKDTISGVEYCKTLSTTPEMSASCVIRITLAALRNNNNVAENGGSEYGRSGPDDDFTLWVRMTRHGAAQQLHGIERVHAIQVCKLRQTLSNEEGFDLDHVNARHNPCGLNFELRKKHAAITKSLSRGDKMWGLPLESVCTGSRPPPALMLILKRLRIIAPRTHGVFRRCPSVRALRMLRDEVDRLGPRATRCPAAETASALLLSALLKDYFRSLPEPLLTTRMYPHWIRLIESDMPESRRVEGAKSLASRLPAPYYVMLAHAICVLAAVARRVEVTEMCAANLGVCVGPSVLWSARTSPSSMGPPSGPAAVVRLLIANAESVFGPRCLSLLGADTPDSGAEESDSLHSLGASLDSTERIPPREKLSLSRDSGLTLSEDDSTSAGNSSPARPLPNDRYARPKIDDVYGMCPQIYTTGLEPPKPPRVRPSNIYGPTKVGGGNITKNTFCRAKSSNDLLDSNWNRNNINNGIKTKSDIYGGSRIRRSENIYDQNQTVYPRQYSEKENRNCGQYDYGVNSSHVNASYLENIYGTNTSMEENEPESQKAPTFTRKDWTRKASRTKSLESGDDVYSSTELLNIPRTEIYGKTSSIDSESCLARLVEPSHLCSNKCSLRFGNKSNDSNSCYGNAMKNIILNDHRNLSHSKSLANIVMQSDSSSSDTLYQRQSASMRSSDSPASENSNENTTYANQYGVTSYMPIYDKRLNVGRHVDYNSDIYTAKLTAVEPEKCYIHPRKLRSNLPPPVPPRNIHNNSTLRRFPSDHMDKNEYIYADDRKMCKGIHSDRNEDYPPTYKDPPKTRSSPKVNGNLRETIALNDHDTDTESESYV